MTLEQQIKDWEKLDKLLDKIVQTRNPSDADLRLYDYFRKDYNNSYKNKFNPMEKPQ
jgi:hypothetical protein